MRGHFALKVTDPIFEMDLQEFLGLLKVGEVPGAHILYAEGPSYNPDTSWTPNTGGDSPGDPKTLPHITKVEEYEYYCVWPCDL